MKGRKRTPTALKVIRGNPGHRPLNPHEPQPGKLDPAIPPELRDKRARAEWVRTIAPATAIGHITEADRTLAIAHCELFTTWRGLLAVARRKGYLVVDKHSGITMPNPARTQANKTLMMLAKIDAELGLTPTARARVTTVKREGEDDPTARFFG